LHWKWWGVTRLLDAPVCHEGALVSTGLSRVERNRLLPAGAIAGRYLRSLESAAFSQAQPIPDVAVV